MLFKDNLSSSLWPWHLSWLEVTSVIFAVVIGATELDVGYHLTVWAVSRSTFEEVVCWGRFRVDSFMNKSKIWIRRSETRVAQQGFSGWTTEKEQKRHAWTQSAVLLCFVLNMKTSSPLSSQQNCFISFSFPPASFPILIQILYWLADSTTSLLASQFRLACHRREAVGQPLPGHHWCWRHCRSQWGGP